jgi:hypothetical protein
MKRAPAAVLLAAVAIAAAGCASSHPATNGAGQAAGVRTVITHAKALREVSSLLRAKPNWIRLVRVNGGQLAWLGFSPRGNPVRECPQPPCQKPPAPVAAYVDARGDRFTGWSDLQLQKEHPSPANVIQALRQHQTVALAVIGARVPFPVGDPATVHPTVTRAEAAQALGAGLGGKLQRLQLVWADEKTTDVDLEWVAFSPRARIVPISGPGVLPGKKSPPLRTYVGPAIAWMNATGPPYAGRETLVRHRGGHSIRPLRSRSIPVSVVQKLWRQKLDVWLAPVDARPTIGRLRALATLDPEDARQIWLVFLRRQGTEGLAWLIARGHGSYAFVSAATGKVLVSSAAHGP